MSNHQYKPENHPQPRKPFPWIKICVPPLVVFLILAPFIRRAIRDRPDTDQWVEVSGQLVTTRIVIVGSHDRGQYRPRAIDYIAEAHVKYEMDGIPRDMWLPASGELTSRAELEVWLSQKKSQLCIVRWNPKNPLRISAVLS